jgi:hypothetical protein
MGLALRTRLRRFKTAPAVLVRASEAQISVGNRKVIKVRLRHYPAVCTLPRRYVHQCNGGRVFDCSWLLCDCTMLNSLQRKTIDLHY